jgi:hypothetical protein
VASAAVKNVDEVTRPIKLVFRRFVIRRGLGTNAEALAEARPEEFGICIFGGGFSPLYGKRLRTLLIVMCGIARR